MRSFLRRARGLALAEGGLPIVWIALTVFALIPLWSVRVLPVLYAPADMVVARIWHSHGDPTFNLSRYYTLGSRFAPGVLYYALMDGLLYLFRIQPSHDLILSLYIVGFPLAALRLGRAFGRSPWLALCAFVLLFNRNWIFGYTGFLLGSALCLWAWALVVEYLESPTNRRLLGLVLLGGLLYLAHPLALVVFTAGELGLLCAERPWGLPLAKRAARLLGAALPWLLLVASTFLSTLADPPGGGAATPLDARFFDLPGLLLAWPGKVLSLFPGALDYNILWIMICTLLVLWWRAGWTRPPRRLLGLLCGAIVAYAFVPWTILKPLSIPNIAGRVAPLIAVLLTLVPNVAPGRSARQRAVRLLLVPLTLAAVVLPMRLLQLYIGFNVRNAPLSRLLRQLPRGASTLLVYRGVRTSESQFDESGDPASSGLVYRYFLDWPGALDGGYAPEVSELGTAVHVHHRLTTPTPILPDDFSIRTAPEYDYYLVRFPPDSLQREPALKMIDQAGDWTLFHRLYDLSEEP